MEIRENCKFQELSTIRHYFIPIFSGGQVKMEMEMENPIVFEDESNQLECDKCNKKFAKKGNFRNHVKECTGKFKCKICSGKFFKAQFSLFAFIF